MPDYGGGVGTGVSGIPGFGGNVGPGAPYGGVTPDEVPPGAWNAATHEGTNQTAVGMLNGIANGLAKIAPLIGRVLISFGIPFPIVSSVIAKAAVKYGHPLTLDQQKAAAEAIIAKGGGDNLSHLPSNPTSQDLYDAGLDWLNDPNQVYQVVEEGIAKQEKGETITNNVPGVSSTTPTSGVSSSGGSGMSNSDPSITTTTNTTATKKPLPRDPEQQALFDEWWAMEHERKGQIAEDVAYQKNLDQGFVNQIGDAYNAYYNENAPTLATLKPVAEAPAGTISFAGPSGQTFSSPFIPGSQRYAQRTRGSMLTDLYNKYLVNAGLGRDVMKGHTPNEASDLYYKELLAQKEADEKRRYQLASLEKTDNKVQSANFEPSTLDTISAWANLAHQTGVDDVLGGYLEDWLKGDTDNGTASNSYMDYLLGSTSGADVADPWMSDWTDYASPLDYVFPG